MKIAQNKHWDTVPWYCFPVICIENIGCCKVYIEAIVFAFHLSYSKLMETILLTVGQFDEGKVNRTETDVWVSLKVLGVGNEVSLTLKW